MLRFRNIIAFALGRMDQWGLNNHAMTEDPWDYTHITTWNFLPFVLRRVGEAPRWVIDLSFAILGHLPRIAGRGLMVDAQVGVNERRKQRPDGQLSQSVATRWDVAAPAKFCWQGCFLPHHASTEGPQSACASRRAHAKIRCSRRREAPVRNYRNPWRTGLMAPSSGVRFKIGSAAHA